MTSPNPVAKARGPVPPEVSATRPLSTLHCIASMDGGGAERQLCYLAQALVKRGHQVHVSLASAGVNIGRLLASGATVHLPPPGGGRTLLALAAHRVRLVARLRPDLVQTWLLQSDLLGGAAAMATRTPWVLGERSSAAAYPPGLRVRLRNLLGRGSAAIVSNSPAGDDYWAGRVGPRVLRRIIPNILPLEDILRAPPAHLADVSDGARVVLYVARLDAGKNLEPFLRALPLSRARDWTAVICGEGPDRARLQSLAAELGISERVRMPGLVRDIWGVMKRADALVSLSRFEGQPNAVLEAMACGTPLVLSDIPGHRAVAPNAEFVRDDRPEGVASAIDRVLEHGTRSRGAGAQAGLEGFGAEAIGAAYEDLYRAVLSRRAVRR